MFKKVIEVHREVAEVATLPPKKIGLMCFGRMKKWKGTEAHRAKHPTPSQAIDAFIGAEEQNEKLRSPPTTHRDHTVSLFFLTPWPTGEK